MAKAAMNVKWRLAQTPLRDGAEIASRPRQGRGRTGGAARGSGPRHTLQ
jgi:hypothetical protein